MDASRPPPDGPVAAALRRAEELLDADDAQRAVDLLEETAAARRAQAPDDAGALWVSMGLAHARLRQDRPDSARDVLARAAESLPAGADDQGAVLGLAAAGVELAAQDLTSAEQRLRPITAAAGPAAGEAWLGLARVALARGLPDEAEAALARAAAGGRLQPALSPALVAVHVAAARGDLDRAEALLAAAANAPGEDPVAAALVRARLQRARWARRREARELLLAVRAVEVALSRARGRSRPIEQREALLHRAVARALSGDGAFAAADARRALEGFWGENGIVGAPPAAPEWPAAWLLADAALAFEAGHDPLAPTAARARDALSRAHAGPAPELFGLPAAPPALREPPPLPPEALTEGPPPRPGVAKDALVRLAFERGYHEAVQAFRREVLRAALRETGGHRTRAAALLGLQRTHLARLIRELEVDAPARDGRSARPGDDKGSGG